MFFPTNFPSHSEHPGKLVSREMEARASGLINIFEIPGPEDPSSMLSYSRAGGLTTFGSSEPLNFSPQISLYPLTKT